MAVNWRLIDSHPEDEDILCVQFDKDGDIDVFGLYRWDTTGRQKKHHAPGKNGLWLAMMGCDACWREQPDFTHWAPLSEIAQPSAAVTDWRHLK